MLESFLAAFKVTGGVPVSPWAGAESVEDFLARAGGREFERGLYRTHTVESSRAADALVEEFFPELRGTVRCFGYDWLGRQFATDSTRGGLDDPEVLMLEPGSGVAYKIPFAFSDFHDEAMVLETEALIAQQVFAEWLSAGQASPAMSECVGYVVPHFLGGEDSFPNMEVIDLDVYWTLTAQMRRQVMGLPPGTPIAGVGQAGAAGLAPVDDEVAGRKARRGRFGGLRLHLGHRFRS